MFCESALIAVQVEYHRHVGSSTLTSIFSMVSSWLRSSLLTRRSWSLHFFLSTFNDQHVFYYIAIALLYMPSLLAFPSDSGVYNGGSMGLVSPQSQFFWLKIDINESGK